METQREEDPIAWVATLRQRKSLEALHSVARGAIAEVADVFASGVR